MNLNEIKFVSSLLRKKGCSHKREKKDTKKWKEEHQRV